MALDDRFSKHMSDEDALMWNIEKDPVLRSTIVAVAVLDRVPDYDAVRERFRRASLVFPRMRQRVLSPPLRLGPPRWAVEPDFDIDFHLRRWRLPAPGSRRVLLDAVAPMAEASFDRARPLWEAAIIEGLEGDRAALVLKVHHSVTDGVGGIEVLAHLVDLERVPAHRPGPPVAEPDPEPLDAPALVRDSLGHTRRRLAGMARRAPGALARTALGAVRDPLGSLVALTDTGRSITRVLAPARAPMSPIMTERGLDRRLDTLDIALDDLKRAAKAADGSINDAFVAAVVGGLHRYHLRHDHAIEHLRMTLPINLRTAADPAAGNRFVPARFPVPAGIPDPVERMQAVGSLVREWRDEPALALTSTLAGVLNRLPTSTVTALFGGMLKCVDFVASNVPGSPIAVYVGGARADEFYAFGPPSGAGVNVTLLSHAGRGCVGVVTDTRAVPDTDVLLEDLRTAFDEVVAVG